MTRAFEALLKDRAIIASEVMHEYDEKVRSRRGGCQQCQMLIKSLP